MINYLFLDSFLSSEYVEGSFLDTQRTPENMKLTDTIIAKTGPGPRELTDDQARGLKVRISRRGTKSFYLFYRIGTTRTLRTFLDQNYYPHAEQTQRSAGYAQRIFENDFQFLMRRELNAITWPDIDKWRTRELSRGIQPQTVNRKLCASKSALNRAVEWAML